MLKELSEKVYKERFVVKTPKEIKIVFTRDISIIEAAGTLCSLIDQQGNIYAYSQNIGNIVEIVPPCTFFRINRSQIININYIESIEKYFKNRLIIKIKGVKTKVYTSSTITAQFRIWLDSF